MRVAELLKIGASKTNLLEKKTKEIEDVKQELALARKELVHQEADCLVRIREVTEGAKKSKAILHFPVSS